MEDPSRQKWNLTLKVVFFITLFVVSLQCLIIFNLRQEVTALRKESSVPHSISKRSVNRVSSNFKCPPGCRRIRADPNRSYYAASGRRESITSPAKDRIVGSDITGLPSNRGLRGVQGPSGNMGPSGIQGPPGQIGEIGLPGIPGSRGRMGIAGSFGIPGTPGTPGSPGVPGTPGRMGESGLPGRAGLPGSPGNSGSQGQLGSQGNPGLPGSPGEDGIPGQSGARGSPGATGGRGQSGNPGQPGYNAYSGYVDHRYQTNSADDSRHDGGQGPELRSRTRGDQGVPTEEESPKPEKRNVAQVLQELQLLDHPKCVDSLDHDALMGKLKDVGKVSFMVMVDLQQNVYCIVHA